MVSCTYSFPHESDELPSLREAVCAMDALGLAAGRVQVRVEHAHRRLCARQAHTGASDSLARIEIALDHSQRLPTERERLHERVAERKVGN